MGSIVSLTYDGKEFPAYLAQPAGNIKGGIIVIHEVWALNDHTKNIADRYAREGYVALAPNLLTMTDIAKYADQLSLDLFNPEKRSEAQPKLRALMVPMQTEEFDTTTLAKLDTCFDYLYDMPDIQQNVAITGFCFGGGYTYKMAIREPRLRAAVPFYGRAPLDSETLRKITCPVLAFYGENDQGLMKDLPELEEKMHEADVDFEAVVYPGCGHAFFNDTNPFAYNEHAARDAWKRALGFLERFIDG